MNTSLIYSFEGQWLLVNGQRCMYCPGNTPQQMQAIVTEYQDLYVKGNNENIAKEWGSIRSKRDNLLKESDWTGLPDATPKPNKESWLAYRQALRDITLSASSPFNIVWPIKPS